MRVLILAVLIFCPAIAPGQTAQPGAPAPLTGREKLELRMRRIVSPMSLLGAATGAAINQWRDEPEEWGQGMEGYGKRVASAEGNHASYNAIALTTDLVFGLEPRYRRMPQAKVKARIWNSLSQTLFAYRDSGGRMINISEFAGSYGSGFIANTWEPKDHSKASDALIRGSIAIAVHAGRNAAREFLPDLLHLVRHSHKTQTNTAAATER
jgi:hypothetical protein